jgi:hypothetical protein
LVIETLRAALEALAAAAPEWLQGFVAEQWYERYGQRARDWRLPKAEAAGAALAVTVGADGFALLEAVHTCKAPGWLREIPAVQTLRLLWLQHYYRDQQGLRWRAKSKPPELPPGAVAIGSPTTPKPATGSSAGGLAWRQGPLHPDLPARPAQPDRARGHHRGYYRGHHRRHRHRC